MSVKKQQQSSILVNGYAYPSIASEVLSDWLPDLSFLLTFSYGMTPEGELIDLDDRAMIETARQGNVESMMVLTSLDQDGRFSDALAKQILENPEAQDRLLENILINLKTKNMAGVDFDLEFIAPENKEQYIEFLTKAQMKLNAEGYIVTAVLAPKTSDDQRGLFYEGHDYYGIGQAANFALIMSYEWGYTYGPPMAVAPLNKVRQVIEYGVSRVPSNKILMGIPNYGYDWKLPFVKGESRATRISNTEAVEIADRYGVEIQFDETAQSPYFYYTDEEGIEHEVWFEDARSLRAKFELIQEFGLAGMGVWDIMSYFPEGSAVLHEMFQIAKI